MTKIYYERDANPSMLRGQRVAVVGYGNQGRSWALNLRDSGLAVEVFTQADASREQAKTEGFTAHDIATAGECDVICTLPGRPHSKPDLRDGEDHAAFHPPCRSGHRRDACA
jgi:ketol-acid reductoisomerase